MPNPIFLSKIHVVASQSRYLPENLLMPHDERKYQSISVVFRRKNNLNKKLGFKKASAAMPIQISRKNRREFFVRKIVPRSLLYVK